MELNKKALEKAIEYLCQKQWAGFKVEEFFEPLDVRRTRKEFAHAIKIYLKEIERHEIKGYEEEVVNP